MKYIHGGFYMISNSTVTVEDIIKWIKDQGGVEISDKTNDPEEKETIERYRRIINGKDD